jgi:hypothetical protein
MTREKTSSIQGEHCYLIYYVFVIYMNSKSCVHIARQTPKTLCTQNSLSLVPMIVTYSDRPDS